MLKKYFILLLLITCLLPTLVFADTYKVTKKEYADHGEITIDLGKTYDSIVLRKGDLNKNGTIDLSDIISLLRKYLNSEDTTNEDIRIGDMDGNGSINLGDIIDLLRAYLQNTETPLVNDPTHINYEYYFHNHSGEITKKEDIVDFMYTAINNGDLSGEAICSEEYTDCIDDFLNIVTSGTVIPYINNFIHPYNSFTRLNFSYWTVPQKIAFSSLRRYTDEEITDVDEKIDEKIAELITDGMTDRDKIKAIHDYIVTIANYDILEIDNDETNDGTYRSSIAYGVLFQGYGICSGYSDTMSIFLNKLGIENYQVGNSEHVWNLINVDGTWYHLDATWDDPMVNTHGVISYLDYPVYDYYLINYQTLTSLDVTEHYFDYNIFKEAY